MTANGLISSETRCGFSRPHFSHMLKCALEQGYRFIGFDEIERLPSGQRACILRHDIDYLPEWAIEMARIECDLGITATYFFQVCSKTYNLREQHIHSIVHKIASMGHAVGLHLDIEWNEELEWGDLTTFCESEKRVFQAITGLAPCRVVSFHNTNRFQDQVLGKEISGVHHTYEARFFSDTKYISDSQGWYEGCVCKIFKEARYERLQLLLHPYIWPENSSGDFVSDVAELIRYRRDELAHYFIRHHPVCSRDADRLLHESGARVKSDDNE